MFVFELHGLAVFAKMDDEVFGGEGAPQMSQVSKAFKSFVSMGVL